MSADTETIREALDVLREVVIDWTRDTREWKIAPAKAEAALAALGRVEERERALTEALGAMVRAVDNHSDPSAVPVAGKPTRKLIQSLNLRMAMGRARAALSSAAGSGEQEQDGRASAVLASRERQTEGRAEE